MAYTTRTLIKQILGKIGTPQSSGETLFGVLEKSMATEGDIQAAADAIKASLATLQTNQAAEDAAIQKILGLGEPDRTANRVKS